MNAFAPVSHMRWVTLLGVGLALLVAGPLIARWAQEVEQRQSSALATERAGLEQEAARFAEDMRLAQSRERNMDAKAIAALLAPVDRLRVTAQLERAATAAHLSHFTYRLAPEQPAKSTTAIDRLAESELTVAADMPLDTDAFDFLQNLGALLPGRLRLKQVSLTRAAADTALGLANIHMEATLDWLSNQSDKEGAP